VSAKPASVPKVDDAKYRQLGDEGMKQVNVRSDRERLHKKTCEEAPRTTPELRSRAFRWVNLLLDLRKRAPIFEKHSCWPAWALLLNLGCARGACADRPEELVSRAQALGAVDCPDGLARCEAGEVSISQLTRVPPSAACPFRHIGRCATSCVLEDATVTLPAKAAMIQLCADALTDNHTAVATGPVPPEGECEEGSYQCTRRTVYGCDPQRGWSPRADCPRACVVDTGTLNADTLAAAAHVLCNREPH
jgi:hypothetical protein